MICIRDLLESVAVEDTASLLSAVDRADRAGVPFDRSATVGFLRNFTIEGIEPYVKYHLYRAGFQPDVIFGDYNAIRQDLIDPESYVHQRHPDVIVLSLMLEELEREYDQVEWTAERLTAELRDLFDLVAAKVQGLVILNTFIPPFLSEFGISLSSASAGRGEKISSVNGFIKDYVKSHCAQFLLADWERLVRVLGEEKSMDYRFWYMARAPFKKDFLNLYALEVCKAIKALKGCAKKCLVLDCDNTLWGGITGEDGLQGIKLDRSEYPGKAYYDFQASVLQLVQRGVLVTLCSKNNEDDVWNVLDNHPQCLLHRPHLSGWRIDWGNKAEGISSLAEELNIGLDSLVFVDDSPAECELVREFLPDVTVLGVPRRLYLYPQLLLRDGLFDTLYTSVEDSKRAAMYRTEQRRQAERARFEHLDDYLASLGMVATIHCVREEEIARVAQLTQKTNQFNLTTRRYSAADIRAFVDDPSCEAYSLSARDKFGDYGLTGVLIARRKGSGGVVDTLLLSCRVIGRKLEIAFLENCMGELRRKWNLMSWEAEYVPTKKNQQVATFWDQMGFLEVKSGCGAKSYRLDSGEPNRAGVDFITVEG